MGDINDMVALPDKMLNSIVGETLSDSGREQVRTLTEQLKKTGFVYKNAIGYWRQQTEGYRLSDEDWHEIEDIVKSVYEA